jgi:hypothetical protein
LDPVRTTKTVNTIFKSVDRTPRMIRIAITPAAFAAIAATLALGTGAC